MRKRNFLGVAFAVALLPSVCWAKTYTVDPDHSSVTFRVRHLFTEVEGRFKQFKGTIAFDPAKPEETKVQGGIAAASIDTNNDKRDEDLRSSNFFDVAKTPDISFETTQITDVNKADMTAKVHGNLTMHGVTKPVVLDGKFLGEAKDPWGNQKAGFHAEGKIDRRDWGLTWNKALEAGNVLVGNDVTIRIDAETAAGDEASAK
jgi:polyisoprenoid-binding protein YceI